MGIDIYLKWNSITEAEEKQQITGWSLISGHLGYLRQAYHKPKNYIGDYPVESLIPECFEDDEGIADIYVAQLEIRLPFVISELKKYFDCAKHDERWAKDGFDNFSETFINKVIKSYTDFVALAKRKEIETNVPCTIIIQ